MFRLCSNKFIGRGAPKSGTATHILHLKQLKNLVDFMRYLKGVVFPGKEFMISKYGLQTTDNGSQTHHHIITTCPDVSGSSHQNFGGCGIRIVGGLPCGRFLAVSGKR